jgi:hypothetical protein
MGKMTRMLFSGSMEWAKDWRDSRHRKRKISYKDEQEQAKIWSTRCKTAGREIRSTYPCRSHSRNVHMNVVGVVVLASPPHDPIQAPQQAAPPSIAHVQHNYDSYSLV